ncbi:MAG: nitrous oxidase accessory protein [Saprospiraceae bacterium]|jgi:nitrous oxidase accessory protein
MKGILFFLLSLVCQSARASTLDVCSTCTYQSIDSAYNQCIAGDTMLIKRGDYKIETWVIDKAITVRGETGAHIISANGSEIVTVTANDVTIEGLTFSGVTTNYLKENAAIRIRKSRRFSINDNTINDCFFAIYLEKAKDGFVGNNLIDGNASSDAASGNGIHAWHCDKLEIQNNEVLHHRDGIYLEFVNNSSVDKNYSHLNNRYGLHYMFSNDDTYTENVIERNGVGVAVMFSRRIIMKNNTFAYNWGHAAYGLLLKEIYDAEIVDNHFIENTVGIFVEGSNRINYLRNEFRRNGWAIKFSGGCDTNVIENNNFLYNSIDLVVSSKLSNNTFNSNYWSEYTGYDLDKDGVGDIPHYPVKLYSYIHQQVPESVVLMRSLFVDIINFAEKVSPVFTPKDVLDNTPKMNRL